MFLSFGMLCFFDFIIEKFNARSFQSFFFEELLYQCFVPNNFIYESYESKKKRKIESLFEFWERSQFKSIFHFNESFKAFSLRIAFPLFWLLSFLKYSSNTDLWILWVCIVEKYLINHRKFIFEGASNWKESSKKLWKAQNHGISMIKNQQNYIPTEIFWRHVQSWMQKYRWSENWKVTLRKSM